jgi:uncharacterized protein YceH (UPF0502 family)
MHKFADISAVEGFLQELAARPEGAMVVELPRQPGSRENRWAHLLGGSPAVDEPAPAAPLSADSHADISVGEIAALKAKLARMEAELESLKNVVGRLCAELGVQAGDKA